jgi:hypothetical protein
MSRELLKQCLDLITDFDKEGLILESGLIFVLRNELAKPEQEPVATVKFIHNKKAPDVDWHCNICIRDGAKLYTAPPRKPWQGLTEHDIELTFLSSGYTAKNFARAIEAKLKEKNHGSV